MRSSSVIGACSQAWAWQYCRARAFRSIQGSRPHRGGCCSSHIIMCEVKRERELHDPAFFAQSVSHTDQMGKALTMLPPPLAWFMLTLGYQQSHHGSLRWWLGLWMILFCYGSIWGTRARLRALAGWLAGLYRPDWGVRSTNASWVISHSNCSTSPRMVLGPWILLAMEATRGAG